MKIDLTEHNIKKIKEMKPNEITDYIKGRLVEIEKDNNVTILYAVESGSRAWGFDNKNSDYDIRFIYCGALYDYLNIDGMTKDVIERQEGKIFDFVGWDIVKALKLMRNSNPQLIGWGESLDNDIYVNKNGFKSTLHNLSLSCYDKKTLVGSYLSMAKKDYKRHIKGKDKIAYKGYLYILRAILCCGYVITHDKHHCIPPVELDRLLNEFHYIVRDRYPLRTGGGHTYTLAEIKEFDEWHNPLMGDDLEIPYQADKIMHDVTAYRYEFRSKDNLNLKGDRIKMFDDFIESEIGFFTDWMSIAESNDNTDMTGGLSNVFRNVLNAYGKVDESIYSKLTGGR